MWCLIYVHLYIRATCTETDPTVTEGPMVVQPFELNLAEKPSPFIGVNFFDSIGPLQKILCKSLSDIWEISARKHGKHEEQNAEQETLLTFLLLLYITLYADHWQKPPGQLGSFLVIHSVVGSAFYCTVIK